MIYAESWNKRFCFKQKRKLKANFFALTAKNYKEKELLEKMEVLLKDLSEK